MTVVFSDTPGDRQEECFLIELKMQIPNFKMAHRVSTINQYQCNMYSHVMLY